MLLESLILFKREEGKVEIKRKREEIDKIGKREEKDF